MAERANRKAKQRAETVGRESFESIHLDLSKEQGKCRFADSGLGWKPSGGGETFTLDKNNIGSAQWSKAAKGHELKVLTRNGEIIQLDGFKEDVWPRFKRTNSSD
jgi:structure-specific recognition protein 1